jgi:hypothetical protein
LARLGFTPGEALLTVSETSKRCPGRQLTK